MNNIKHKGEATIFENPFLESLTKSTPTSTILTYGAVIVLLVYYSLSNQFTTIASTIQLYLFGVFFWTFAEYMMHRYVFHFIHESKIGQKIHYALHGSHHEYPNDSQRLFMPPVPGIVFILVFGTIFYLFLGSYSLVFLAGFVNGYLMYSFIHYSTHTIRRPSRFLRPLWYYHHLHHFKYPDKVFGVSSPFWDYVFRTMPPKKDRYKFRKKKK